MIEQAILNILNYNPYELLVFIPITLTVVACLILSYFFIQKYGE